ncbi:phage tail domain-containing protein [Paenibacillus sinopodophylli]|uniref:phage tail domain-containing protein n=1 Tax=Paenibacillus sinopodophylli TaxID=1837342 RepID=UPI00110D0EAA|nr:phage tail domain-containing protein [Paenibacillus sinopodophylli]
MIEAYIDGIPWSSLGIGIKRRDIPPLPETRDYTVQIAGRDGEVDFGSEYSPRIITHECVLMANDPTLDYQAKVREIARVFDAKRGDRTITYSDLPGKRYRARYAGTLSIEKIIFDGMFQLPLKMHNPFPESDQENLEELVLTQSPQTLTIESDGDLSASPIFVLTNIGSNTINGFQIKNEYKLE